MAISSVIIFSIFLNSSSTSSSDSSVPVFPSSLWDAEPAMLSPFCSVKLFFTLESIHALFPHSFPRNNLLWPAPFWLPSLLTNEVEGQEHWSLLKSLTAPLIVLLQGGLASFSQSYCESEWGLVRGYPSGLSSTSDGQKDQKSPQKIENKRTSTVT